jgi:hypothetical protein
MAEEGLWDEARKLAVTNNLEEGVIGDSGRLIVDVTHHDAFPSVPTSVRHLPQLV